VQERIFQTGGERSALNGRLRRVIGELTQDRMDHRREDQALYSGIRGGFDNRHSDLGPVWKECGGDIEHSNDALHCAAHASFVRKVADNYVLGASRLYHFDFVRTPDKAADVCATLR